MLETQPQTPETVPATETEVPLVTLSDAAVAKLKVTDTGDALAAKGSVWISGGDPVELAAVVRLVTEAGEIRAHGKTVKRGDWITVDGASGEVIEGQIPTVKPEPGPDFHELMGWADEFRRLRVRTNADNPAERYHAPNTLKAIETLKLTSGHRLYSDVAVVVTAACPRADEPMP